MPKRKKVAAGRTQNFAWHQSAQRVELDSNAGSNSPTASSEPLPTSESQPVASSSKSTLDKVQTTRENTKSHTPESPDNLVGGLDNLSLGVAPGDEIVLEDPPDDIEDPADNRNPTSLGDPEGNEALHLESEPIATKDSSDDEASGQKTKSSNRRRIPLAKVDEMACSLDELIQSSLHWIGTRRVTSLSEVVLTRVRFMFGTLNLMMQKDLTLTDASSMAAAVFGRGEWAARQVRKWIRAYEENNALPTSVYCNWNGSVIEDEDLSAAIQYWLRGRGKYVGARDIIDFFGTEAAVRFSQLIEAPPSLRTAQRWMHRMGYTWMKEKRGQFADGHERNDVRDYRENFYVPEWTKLERRMRRWDSEGKEIPPELAEGERIVVVWFHDESTFYAHDRRLTRWVHKSETAGIYKKGEGVSLMVADFVSADYGWLRAAPEPPGSVVEGETPKNARVIFRAGKQRDGWFGTTHVVKQLSDAMSIIKKRYPNEDHVFIFDNATIHTKLPETSPSVNRMTLGPSQKVKGERTVPSGEKTSVEYAPAILPDGTIQQLYHPLDHPISKLRGAFKGMAQILEERGILNARKLKLVCAPTDSDPQGCPPGSTNCCARRTMMNQPDILAQKSIIQLQAKAEGFSVMYLPKYHCELNPIEQCWGAAKRVYRDSPPSSTEADLKRNMLNALESVKLVSIRRFAARSQRFVHAYGRGLSGSEAAWAAKQYRGHRIIPDALLEAMDDKE